MQARQYAGARCSGVLIGMKIDISPIDKRGRGLFDERRGRVRVHGRDRARAPVAQGHSVA